jgi:hypothetical protein
MGGRVVEYERGRRVSKQVGTRQGKMVEERGVGLVRQQAAT